MRELKQSLQLLKEKFQRAGVEQNGAINALKEILVSWSMPNFSDLMESVTVKRGQLFIKTKNKSVANELWLRRAELLRLIQQKQPLVTEIKVY